jgi:hypothetical protein
VGRASRAKLWTGQPRTIEQSIEGCQERSASLSPERGELHPESGILEGNGLVAAQQESNESNEAQQKGWHLRRLLVSIAFKVKLLWADAIMAKHTSAPMHRS